jgi:fructokinase
LPIQVQAAVSGTGIYWVAIAGDKVKPQDFDRSNKQLTIVGLGEVLFDVFEDGTATLGGAPLNVAVHAHQLASTLGVGEGVVVSRIGIDAHGDQILESLAKRGMCTEHIQFDPMHPTGTVSVFMNGAEPGYQIDANAAWDFLERKESLDELAARCNAVCFGSLAQRSKQSRDVIQAFLANASRAIRLYDVNLRRNTVTDEPGYSTEIIEQSCELATMMKVNCAELIELCGLLDITAPPICDEDDLATAAARLMQKFPIESLIVTRGAKGTTLFTKGGEFNGHLPLVSLDDVHPVGAGDACSAGVLFGSMLGWHADETIDLANQMGTWVASQLSATPALPPSILNFAMEVMQARQVEQRRIG